MNNKRIVAVVAALAVAGAVVYVVRGRANNDSADEPRTAAPKPPIPPPTATPPKSEPAAPVAAAIAVDVDDDPAGAIRLEGQVIDDAERPVARATVAIDANPPREVVCEDDGSFAFDALLPRTYQLRARGDGGLQAGPVVVAVTATTEPVVLRMSTGAVVAVTVVDAASHEPVADAAVELRGTLRLSARTNADGVATVDGVGPGWPILYVDAKGYAPARREIGVRGVSGPPETHRVELSPGAAVSGRVIDARGKPVAGVKVLPDDVSEPFPVIDRRLDAVTTDRKGEWRFAALPAGTFRFHARHDELAPAASPPVSIDGQNPRTGVDIRVDAGARVRGRVVTPDGQPVAAATVRVAARDGGVWWHATRQALSADDGTFTLTGLPRVPVDVIASHEVGASAIATVDLRDKAEVADLTLTIDVDGYVAGVVVDGAGQPVPEARVRATPEAQATPEDLREWRLRGQVAGVADSGGKFALHGLPPGQYRLRAAHPDASEDAFELGPGVSASPGDHDVRIVLEARGIVVGKVQFDDGTTPAVYSVAADDATPRTMSRDDGGFTLEIPAGTHNVVVTGPDFVRKLVPDIEIRPDDTTDVGVVKVARGRSVSGRVLDSSGRTVAGAQVSLGSQLTGSGTESYIESESPGARETRTGDDGRFVFEGVGAGSKMLVADGGARGRARSVAVPAGGRSAQIDLVLGTVGSLEGHVTLNGEPLGSAVLVASSRAASRSNFFTITGPDGSYRLERLATDDYYVNVMRGGGGGRPKDMTVRSASVGVDTTTTLDIDIATGDIELSVKVRDAKGEAIPTAWIIVASGRVAAARIGDVFETIVNRGHGSVYMRMLLFGRPAVVESVSAGVYTACAIPIVGDINNPAEMQKLQEDMESLGLYCATGEVKSAPDQQIVIDVPPA